jgi:hypothetical protein
MYKMSILLEKWMVFSRIYENDKLLFLKKSGSDPDPELM